MPAVERSSSWNVVDGDGRGSWRLQVDQAVCTLHTRPGEMKKIFGLNGLVAMREPDEL